MQPRLDSKELCADLELLTFLSLPPSVGITAWTTMSRHFSHSLNARYKATFQDYLRFSWQKWEGSSFCQEKPNLLTKDHYMVKPKKEKLARDSVGVHQFVKVCFKVFCIAYQGVG